MRSRQGCPRGQGSEAESGSLPFGSVDSFSQPRLEFPVRHGFPGGKGRAYLFMQKVLQRFKHLHAFDYVCHRLSVLKRTKKKKYLQQGPSRRIWKIQPLCPGEMPRTRLWMWVLAFPPGLGTQRAGAYQGLDEGMSGSEYYSLTDAVPQFPDLQKVSQVHRKGILGAIIQGKP